MKEIEKRRKEQNQLEKDAALDIRQKDLETEVKILVSSSTRAILCIWNKFYSILNLWQI